MDEENKTLREFHRRSKTRLKCSVWPVSRFCSRTGSVKRLTREQVEARKEKAATFTESVLGDSDRADAIRDESLESYAERRRFEITNPTRRRNMPRGSRDPQREQIRDLKEQIRDLEEENESLQDQLDTIAEIVAPDESENDEDPE
jgi:hypothetical protein